MATLNSNELRGGDVFVQDGNHYVVLKYSHMKKGRGQATIRVKVKNIETGSITELTYTNEQKVITAEIEKRSVQYLYSDENVSYFMDMNDYSQFTIEKEIVEDQLQWLKDGEKVVVMFLEGNPISIELPKSVELEVTETAPAVAGNTATGAMKNAIMETGVKIQVPLFIKNGDVLKINTDSGTYVSRV